MSFALQGAPASFQYLMNQVLAGLTFKNCLAYIDDIICLSKDFSEHLSQTKLVSFRSGGSSISRSCGFQGRCVS